MAYIGNEPEIGFNTALVQKFNGDGACTQFTITQPISDPDYLEVLVNNVQQEPYASYSVASGLITFTEAPSVGANNIQVGMKSQSVVYYNQVTSSQLVDGSIGGTKLIDGSVTGNKLGVTSVRGNNIAVGQITGNLIGTGAISANNFAGGGVGSGSLSQNLTLSTIRIAETVNVQTTPISGNYNIHVAEATAYYFVANTTGPVTFNLIGNTTTSLNSLLSVGQTASLAIALKQGVTRYRANVFIDGVNPLSSVVWMGASQPAQLGTQTQSVDAYSITVIKTENNGYTVMVGNTTFASANGQGMGPGGVQ